MLLIGQLGQLVAMVVLLFSFIGFVSVFLAYPVVRKYLIDVPDERARLSRI